jgi:hypothetical protein
MLSAVAPGTRAAAMIFASRFVRPSRAAAIASMLCSGTTPVYGWFTEGFDTRDLKEAKALLDGLT